MIREEDLVGRQGCSSGIAASHVGRNGGPEKAGIQEKQNHPAGRPLLDVGIHIHLDQNLGQTARKCKPGLVVADPGNLEWIKTCVRVVFFLRCQKFQKKLKVEKYAGRGS